MLFSPESTDLLRYQRSAIDAGEWWRIISANFCHTGWNHWLLNIIGLILIDYLYQPFLSQWQRSRLMLFCICLNVLLIHLWLNNASYVGLSGALHGYLLGCALLSFQKSLVSNSLVIIIISVKLFVELNWQVNQATEKFIQARILEESHLYGAISSVLYCFIKYLKVLISFNQKTNKD